MAMGLLDDAERVIVADTGHQPGAGALQPSGAAYRSHSTRPLNRFQRELENDLMSILANSTGLVLANSSLRHQRRAVRPGGAAMTDKEPRQRFLDTPYILQIVSLEQI